MSVYFIQAVTGGPIKIGFATDIDKRLSTLQTGSASALLLLASTAGSFSDERALHRQLKEHQVSGEWFAPHDEVLAVVDFARAGRPISEIIPDPKPNTRLDWTPRSDEEAFLRETLAETIIAAYGQGPGWALRAAKDAQVTDECIKRWTRRKTLPQCAQLVIFGRKCPAIRNWVASVLVALMENGDRDS